MSEERAKYEWSPIEDLPERVQRIARPDLDDSLASWTREKQSLQDQERVNRLHDRLATEWAIETGVIERLYTIDRGLTATLIDLGLQALDRFSSAGRVGTSAAKLIEDQRAALEFVFAAIRQERPLSNSLIKELHQLLCQNQTHCEGVDQFGNKVSLMLVKGDWKKLPNNPTRQDGAVHEYCPPEFVQDEMDSLLRMHFDHVERRIRPEVEAAWLHHRFTQIHPFQDGNGRVARALATLVFLQHDFLPLVIRNAEHKDLYIAALESADAGDLQPLVNLFANIQSADLEAAITFVREIRGEGLGQIATAAALAAKRRQQEREAQLVAKTDELVSKCKARLTEVAYELQTAFEQEGIRLFTAVMKSDESNESYWHSQVIAAAKEYGYFADLARPRRWVQLRLTLEGPGVSRWNVVISFHHKEVRSGLMAAVAFLTTTESGLEEGRPVELGSRSEFSFSATTRELSAAFAQWLDECLPILLDRWQARI
jgi:Fic family protein